MPFYFLFFLNSINSCLYYLQIAAAGQHYKYPLMGFKSVWAWDIKRDHRDKQGCLSLKSLHRKEKMGRAPCCEKMGLKKGPWTPEEDQILVNYIHLYGHGNWRALPKQAGKYSIQSKLSRKKERKKEREKSLEHPGRRNLEEGLVCSMYISMIKGMETMLFQFHFSGFFRLIPLPTALYMYLTYGICESKLHFSLWFFRLIEVWKELQTSMDELSEAGYQTGKLHQWRRRNYHRVTWKAGQ